jgi:zinc transporter ZupT
LTILRQFLFLLLREPFRSFLDKQFSLFPGIRLRVHFWKKIAVSLNQKGRHSSE